MTTTWDVLNANLSYFLSDVPKAGGAYKHALPLRVSAWNYAQREFVAHTARECSTQVALESSRRVALLPDDFFEVAQIYDPLNFVIYVPMRFEPGGYRSDIDENLTYWIWGGQLHFGRTVAEPQLWLYYFAYWPEVTYRTNESDELEIIHGEIAVPGWAELPLLHLAAATILQPMAVDSARNREYATRLDSGKPTDNSRALQAREHLFWYRELLGQHTPQNRMRGVQ